MAITYTNAEQLRMAIYKAPTTQHLEAIYKDNKEMITGNPLTAQAYFDRCIKVKGKLNVRDRLPTNSEGHEGGTAYQFVSTDTESI